MAKNPIRAIENYSPFLKTKRFDIFKHRVVRNPKQGLPRDMFTAWHHSEDVPRPVCEVVIYPHTVFGNFVEWVHVCEEHRRQGIATEVITAIEQTYGALVLTGATKVGEKFVASYEKKKKPTKVKRVARKRS